MKGSGCPPAQATPALRAKDRVQQPMQDYYEILQVHPRSDQETIRDSYERLIQRHDPAKLHGAAEELIELTRRKRDDIERAYAVLGDATRRATYDEEQQALRAQQDDQEISEEDRLDYSPLPPAHGQERPRDFNAQPLLARQQLLQRGRKSRQPKKRQPLWFTPAIVVAVLTFIIMFASLLLTGGGQMRYATEAAGQSSAPGTGQTGQGTDAPEHPDVIGEYEGQVVAARQVVDALPDNPEAWIRLGDALYDSVQVVREFQPDSELYQERLPRWLEASDAYKKALELDPAHAESNTIVRSDMGVSLCYYGVGTGNQDYVKEGMEYTGAALQADKENGRILLNHGICLISSEPPQKAEALQLWQQVLSLPAVEPGVNQQAQRLIEEYSQ